VLALFLATFATVFIAELPDKTMVATLVLTATYRRPFAVWTGVAAAFAVHALGATLAGGLISRLPHRAVALATAVLFGIGALVMWRQRNEQIESHTATSEERRPFGRVALTGFATVIVAEFGDLTQLTIAGLSARSSHRVVVFAGGMLGLWGVAALAAVAGRSILARLRPKLLHTIATAIFAALSAWSLTSAL
jgi:putative Ca2+/H+ antiporter (TMEM165/GDT1 family)